MGPPGLRLDHNEPVNVTALVFTGMTGRDVLAPLLVAEEAGPVVFAAMSPTPGPCQAFEPRHTFEAEPLDDSRRCDVLIIPGGLGSRSMMHDDEVIAWLRQIASRSRYVLGVSTGSLLLAAAGLLEGIEASGHWLTLDDLLAAGARPTTDPLSWSDKVITATSGLSAATAMQDLAPRVRYGREP